MVISATLIIMVCGCATSGSGKMDLYREKYEPLMGKTENEIIEIKGAPKEIQQAGDYKIYVYYVSHGARGHGMMFGNGMLATQSKESYDQARIYFKDGKSVKWDAEWQ